MTSTFFQRVLILILLAGSFTGIHAQEYKYEIGGMAGGAFYMGDANKNAFFKGMNPAVGAVFRYNANFRWAFKANLMWGQVSGSTEGLENVFPDNAQASFSRSWWSWADRWSLTSFRTVISLITQGRSDSLRTYSWDWELHTAQGMKHFSDRIFPWE